MTKSKKLSFENAKVVRKSGENYRLRREVDAINFISSHTSIPVPVIIKQQTAGGSEDVGWFSMERLEGITLNQAWSLMTIDAFAKTLQQLQFYFEELRNLSPPMPGWIGSCNGGPAYDHRLHTIQVFGPFTSISAFHDHLVEPVKRCPRPDWAAKYRNKLPDDCTVVFAHADIGWDHIFVHPSTGIVTGIIDWEMAGFWPEWWEYRKALYGGRSQHWWRKVVKTIMKEYLIETEADMDLEMF